MKKLRKLAILVMFMSLIFGISACSSKKSTDLVVTDTSVEQESYSLENVNLREVTLNKIYEDEEFEAATGIDLEKYDVADDSRPHGYKYIEGTLKDTEYNYNNFTVENINDFFVNFRDKKIIVSEIVERFGLPDEFSFYRGSYKDYNSPYITMRWYLADENTERRNREISIHWDAVAKDASFSKPGTFKIDGGASDSIDVYFELMIGKQSGEFIGAHYTREEAELADAKNN